MKTAQDNPPGKPTAKKKFCILGGLGAWPRCRGFVQLTRLLSKEDYDYEIHILPQ